MGEKRVDLRNVRIVREPQPPGRVFPFMMEWEAFRLLEEKQWRVRFRNLEVWRAAAGAKVPVQK